MAKTYRHIYTFEGNKPLDKVKSVETYERLKDVPELGENQLMSSGQNKTPMCNNITCGTFQVQISNLYNAEGTIEDAVMFIHGLQFAMDFNITPEMIEELEDSKKNTLEFLYGNVYGKKKFGKLNPINVVIKSKIGRD